jgi:hypothetical protein
LVSKGRGARRSSDRGPRWLVIQASALLESVATANYACYGRGGVPHYPAGQPAAPSSRPSPNGTTLCVELIVRDAQGAVRLACLDLDLKNLEHSARQIAWSGYDQARHMQVLWVWDFYRILSHVALRAAVPAQDETPDATWQGTLDAIRAVTPGDEIRIEVRSACGDIHQSHTVEHKAVDWKPK